MEGTLGAVMLSREGGGSITGRRAKLDTRRSWLESIKSESLEQRMDVKDSNWQFGKPEDVTIEERMTSILESDWPLFIK